MKKWLFMLLLSAVLVGCDEKTNESKNVDMLTPVEVTILTEKELPVGEEIELAAQVMQGSDYVNDADEVKFEVWESGLRDEQGIMLEGELQKDGIYIVNHTFNHDGVYYMYAHTTARSMHVMPKQQLVVGSPDMSKVLEDNSDDSMNHNNGGNDSGHH